MTASKNKAEVIYFGQKVTVTCDRKCNKAWGASSRPKNKGGFDMSDDEFGEAPQDPGTYEGGHAKPLSPDAFPNKWCVRECERCTHTTIAKESE